MSFVWALVMISLAAAAAERLWPARPVQSQLRTGLGRDLMYQALNGHLAGVALAIVTARAARAGLMPDVSALRVVFTWPWAVQLAVQLVAFDFMQWLVHNLLHRVDVLWRFHKVHHQIQAIDWLANLHFHPVEILVYRTLLWLPSALAGFADSVLFASAVIGTAWGHLNHANVRWPRGWHEYVLNGPRMHLWHHAHLEETQGRPVNMAILFSAWDWLFGTAWLPPEPPRALGFAGVERYPEDLPGQLAEPFRSS